MGYISRKDEADISRVLNHTFEDIQISFKTDDVVNKESEDKWNLDKILADARNQAS